MKVAFYIGRMNYLGHFGTLIDYYLSKASDVTLLCDNRSSKKAHGYKSYLYPDSNNTKKVFNKAEVKAFDTTEEFANIILDNQVQVVFFCAIDTIAQEAKAILGEKAKDIIFAHLQTGADIVAAGNLALADIVFIFTENWRVWWKQWLSQYKIISREEQKDVFEQIDSKTIVSGLPHADQMATCDRQEICKKYSLPKDKKIILYLSFPWRVPFSILSHIVYKPQSRLIKLAKLFLYGQWQRATDAFNSALADDLQVTKSIRQFADRNNAFLLVKARRKNKIPSYLEILADKVIYDETYYPFTIDELMSIADICIHFYSDAVKETVLSDTPCICLGPEKPEDWPCYFVMDFIKDLSSGPMSYYNYDGLIYNIFVETFVKKFHGQTFDDYIFKVENKNKFVQKFLGYSDLKSSERIYNHITNLLAAV